MVPVLGGGVEEGVGEAEPDGGVREGLGRAMVEVGEEEEERGICLGLEDTEGGPGADRGVCTNCTCMGSGGICICICTDGGSIWVATRGVLEVSTPALPPLASCPARKGAARRFPPEALRCRGGQGCGPVQARWGRSSVGCEADSSRASWVRRPRAGSPWVLWRSSASFAPCWPHTRLRMSGGRDATATATAPPTEEGGTL